LLWCPPPPTEATQPSGPYWPGSAASSPRFPLTLQPRFLRQDRVPVDVPGNQSTAASAQHPVFVLPASGFVALHPATKVDVVGRQRQRQRASCRSLRWLLA